MTSLILRASSLIAAIAGIAMLLSSFGSRALAQQVPSAGPFSISYTSTNAAPMKPLVIGKGRETWVYTNLMSAVNDAHTGLLNNMMGRCSGIATTDSTAKTVELHGYCNYSDKDGDQVFEQYDFPVQPQGATINATAKWLGGTGKWAGLQGDFEIHAAPQKPLADGVTQSAGKKIGTYKIVKI
jgi:hypothetical protein